MFDWIKTNWLNYGQWYMNADSIVGYMNPIYKVGSLTITILTKNRFQGGIPGLPVGYKYSVNIVVDGVSYSHDVDLFTPDQIRQWAQDNKGELGLWQIVTHPGSFNDDFNDDFQVYLQVLVVYTSQAQSVTIDINTEVQ